MNIAYLSSLAIHGYVSKQKIPLRELKGIRFTTIW